MAAAEAANSVAIEVNTKVAAANTARTAATKARVADSDGHKLDVAPTGVAAQRAVAR